MLKKNLSAETLLCDCCCQDSRMRVPELDYHICEKKIGIIPTSLKIVLDKREKYKELKNNAASNPKLKVIYDARQSALKWILVTSFGYLGFNNAKFGRIDAHIAVCAFDRQILLQTLKIAERHGFRVLHGIVDSIWVKRKRNTKITNMMQDEENYARLQRSIEQKTGFTIPFEGKYKWIAFVHSKVNNALPVANRYFGVFEDGCLKIRGIEARRHDTPMLLSKFQQEILEVMSKGKGKNIGEVKALMPKVNGTFQKYVQLLKQSKIPFEELVFTKRISKNSKEYQKRNTVESNSIHLLDVEGKSLKAGEILEYVITDYYETQSKNRRAIPIELINENTTSYDVRRYVELLAETCNSVIEPFGFTVVV
jgi:DNA polymerase I